MPNIIQQDALDRFIGKEGLYFETIRDDEAFDLGTKVLYLERAISQDCVTFLRSLDKLYNFELVDAEKEANLDFIRSLKAINDLCWNNNINREEYGVKEALQYYFDKLGPVDPADFKLAIQNTINERITALRVSHADSADTQKTEREIAETKISLLHLPKKRTEWRQKLKLPKEQQAALLGTLTMGQYAQLPPEIKKIIPRGQDATRNTHIACILIGDAVLTFDALLKSSVNNLQELIEGHGRALTLLDKADIQRIDLLRFGPVVRKELLCFPFNVVQLVKEAKIPLTELLNLDPMVREELLRSSSGVVQLVKKAKIPLTELLKLDPVLRTELFHSASRVALLVREARIPLTELLKYPPTVREELFHFSLCVVELVGRAKISFTEVLKLPPAVRIKFYQHSSIVAQLVNEMKIPFTELLELPSAVRDELFDSSSKVIYLMRELKIPLTQLLKLDPAVRAELLQQRQAVAQLVNQAKIPLTALLDLPTELRQKFFNSPSHVVKLMDHVGIPFSGLLERDPAVRTAVLSQYSKFAQLWDNKKPPLIELSLFAEQLRMIIDNPESEASQRVLNPSSPTRGSGMFSTISPLTSSLEKRPLLEGDDEKLTTKIPRFCKKFNLGATGSRIAPRQPASRWPVSFVLLSTSLQRIAT